MTPIKVFLVGIVEIIYSLQYLLKIHYLLSFAKTLLILFPMRIYLHSSQYSNFIDVELRN